MSYARRVIGMSTAGLALLAACVGGPASTGTGTGTGTDIGTSSTSSSSSGASSGSSGTSSSSSASSSSSGGGSSSSGGCRHATECAAPGQRCIGGNVPAGCGGAYIHDCDVDADCRKDGGVTVCSKGDCSGQNQCVVPQCTGPTDTTCGINKVCTDQQCVAKPCGGDGECAGFCVNGVCDSALGHCGTQAEYP